MPGLKIASVLLLLASMLALAEMRQQQRWKRLSVPPDYWQKLSSVQEEQAYGTFFDCAAGCMVEEQCQAR